MAIKEWMISNPKLSISVFAFLVTLIMTLITKHFTDQKRMKELKDMQKSHQAKMKEHKDDPKKMGELQKEIMESTFELMKHSFKPLFVTLLPLLLFFWWIKEVYTPVLPGWLWWYIGVGVISSIVLRKVLKVV